MHKLIAVMFLSVTMIHAEDPNGASVPPISARYEIAQTAAGVFKLDRYTGKIATIVNPRGVEYQWREMQVTDLPTTAASEARFQLSFRGTQRIFLIDTATGKTWLYYQFPADRNQQWVPIENLPAN